MDIIDGHKIIRTQPINPDTLPPDFPRIVLQDYESYVPPTCKNRRVGITERFDVKKDMVNLVQYRGDKNTPTALTQHYRWACASEKRLRELQKCTTGFHVRHGTWKLLQEQLPCLSCVVGQIRKQHKTKPANFVANPQGVSSDTPDNNTEEDIRANCYYSTSKSTICSS